jgi:calcineurin-like phosphoesterase
MHPSCPGGKSVVTNGKHMYSQPSITEDYAAEIVVSPENFSVAVRGVGFYKSIPDVIECE